MAKRGRKKKSKVTQLSSADKNHLSRILKKVRQIKANKTDTSGFGGKVNASLVFSLQQQVNAQQANLLRFANSGVDLSKPTNINTFNSLGAALADVQKRLVMAQLGQIQK